MNQRELAFCAHYAVSRNALQACLSAGYSTSFAHHHAHELTNRPHIQEQLKHLAERTNELMAMDVNLAVNELGAIVTTRPYELMEKINDWWRWKHPDDLTERQHAAVKEIKVLDHYEDDAEGHRVLVSQTFKYTLHEKLPALFKLGEHLGIGSVVDPNKRNVFEDLPQEDLDRLTEAMRAAMEPKGITVDA